MKIENLIGETLIHRVFGTGVIEDVHGKYLEVEREGRQQRKNDFWRQENQWSIGRCIKGEKIYN